jgi:branched-subunit amino acid aminotransferase/4-amino-4-deoxychorismate lyase
MGPSAWTQQRRFARPPSCWLAPMSIAYSAYAACTCGRKFVRLPAHLEGVFRTQVLNYGQAIFEGMKAQRTAKGDIVLFRPTANAERMREGATRMSMVPPPEDLFLRGVFGAVRENASSVPPVGKGSLYLRPLLLGTGPIIGLGPAPSFTFTVFGTAVGSYFKVPTPATAANITPPVIIVRSLSTTGHCVNGILRTGWLAWYTGGSEI